MSFVPSSAMAARLVATLALAYAVSQFLRASVGVIAPELMRDLSLSPEAAGGLTGIFFAVFAAMQIPAGIALDRFGARRVMIAMAGFAVAGCLVFAAAEGMAGLSIGRALMGIGCSVMLMGPYVIYARAFPSARFAQVASIQLGVGGIGAILATAPLAVLAATFGWRWVFVGAAVVTVLFAVATAIVTAPVPVTRRSHSLSGDLKGVVAVFRLPRMGYLLPLVAVGYGTYAAVLTLWGGPYFADVYGLDPAARGGVLMIIAVANIVGFFLYGPLDRLFRSRKWVVVVSIAINIAIWLILGFNPALPLAMTVSLLTILACTNGCIAVLTAHNRDRLPDDLIGRGVTVANMVNMLGAGVLQILLGVLAGILESGRRGESALQPSTYGALFLALAVVLSVALALYLKVPDNPPYAPNDGN